jgi:hypothetical protein
MMPLATEQGKEHALKQLEERRANPPERIDNSSLMAGSPMYFYCISCGHLSDTKDESFTSPIKRLCPECFALQSLGWLV